MSERFVTEMHDIADRMYEASKYLCEMSLHLGMVGLDKLAGQLEGEAAQLVSDAEKLRLLIGEKVAEDVKAAEQATTNMVRAALAMGEKAKRDA